MVIKYDYADEREYDYAERNVDYATTFNQAMASYSAAQTTWVLEALETAKFTNVTHICDVGGEICL